MMSTNKVYGDAPNRIPLRELDTRWDYADPAFAHGIPETFTIDQSKHSLFGASKVAADVMVQEYGRYFGMPTCCLRGGCLTGPNHSGVELHGFLSLPGEVQPRIDGRIPVFGYKGKQVRDNIHSLDVARFIAAFADAPRSRRGLQPRRRQGELVLDPRSVRDHRAVDRTKADLHLRRPESRRRSHLLHTPTCARCARTIRTGTSPGRCPRRCRRLSPRGSRPARMPEARIAAAAVSRRRAGRGELSRLGADLPVAAAISGRSAGASSRPTCSRPAPIAACPVFATTRWRLGGGGCCTRGFMRGIRGGCWRAPAGGCRRSAPCSIRSPRRRC